MFVNSVKLAQFRCFARGEAEFEYPGKRPETPPDFLPNVTLLLGINGAGKTTILKAVALAALAPVIQDSGYRPYYLVRRSKTGPASKAGISCALTLHGEDLGTKVGAEVATSAPAIRIQVRGSYESIRSVRKIAHPERILDDGSPSYFLVGYGATRRADSVENLDAKSVKRRGLRYQRVAGLFEEYITLYPLAAWLPDLLRNPARFAEVNSIFTRVLPEKTRLVRRVEENEAVFRRRAIELPFGALSDGYRAFIGLVSDLLYHLNVSCPKNRKLTDLSGVVLVDDIDLHLHPSWQRTVVPSLATTFPRLQFILTSHSPLVVGTLHAHNVRVVEDAKIREFAERVHGLSADQLLSSSYFDVPPRSTAMTKKLDDLSQVVAQRADPQAAIAFLRELAGKEPTTAGSTG